MSTHVALETLADVAEHADYSLLRELSADPDATDTGDDHEPRQVFSGHYVPVTPTPLPDPAYVAHSESLFAELGFDEAFSRSPDFTKFFSGDLTTAPPPLKRHGWATGYALSIYGQEMVQQCPFRTGNGYGDGRALSVLEGTFRGRRWEMQLKGAGRTPYCRGGDGRAVLRSSVREFLAQEHMHALGVPTTRSLSLFASRTESIRRPWYSENSMSTDPDRWVWDPAAISTRVAPSFLRVGQLELFARRARRHEHPRAMQELEMLLHHVVDREYAEISKELAPAERFVKLAHAFRDRLTRLVAHWIRVGYCQGNFNSDNCALGGFTLDYGPFGFMELFEPAFQPWTGGGRHFCFFNQPAAAEQNFEMFWRSVLTWDGFDDGQRDELQQIRRDFGAIMRDRLDQVWQDKLGLPSHEPVLVRRLLALMVQTPLDYTVFFRELSEIPRDLAPLKTSFYPVGEATDDTEWSAWLSDWRAIALEGRSEAEVRRQVKAVNPKYILREWHLAPAYQAAAQGDYTRVRALQAVMTHPYDDQANAAGFYALRPLEHFGKGGICHMSCSS